MAANSPDTHTFDTCTHNTDTDLGTLLDAALGAVEEYDMTTLDKFVGFVALVKNAIPEIASLVLFAHPDHLNMLQLVDDDRICRLLLPVFARKQLPKCKTLFEWACTHHGYKIEDCLAKTKELDLAIDNEMAVEAAFHSRTFGKFVQECGFESALEYTKSGRRDLAETFGITENDLFAALEPIKDDIAEIVRKYEDLEGLHIYRDQVIDSILRKRTDNAGLVVSHFSGTSLDGAWRKGFLLESTKALANDGSSISTSDTAN